MTAALKADYNSYISRGPLRPRRLEIMQMKQRFILAVAIGAFLVVPMSISLADTAGRDYSRCINSCNAVKQACTGRCADDCAILFPNDSVARNACVAQCKDICFLEDKECKDRCQAIKNGVCPSEP